MKIDKCKWFGHKWTPVYFKGMFLDIPVKFIGCYCERCKKGFDELHQTTKGMTSNQYNTYAERFFDD